MNLSDYPEFEKLACIDKQLAYRLKHVRSEALIKACGIKATRQVTIVDATAGFGQDSLLLAASGAHVTMIERHPLLQLCLKKILQDLKAQNSELYMHLNLIGEDSAVTLAKLETDIIYMDPMFPARTKSAKVQKRMVLLQGLLGQLENTEDPAILLTAALKNSAKRIVVKRPRLAPPLKTPSFSHEYKSCRFDVYLKP